MTNRTELCVIGIIGSISSSPFKQTMNTSDRNADLPNSSLADGSVISPKPDLSPLGVCALVFLGLAGPALSFGQWGAVGYAQVDLEDFWVACHFRGLPFCNHRGAYSKGFAVHPLGLGCVHCIHGLDVGDFHPAHCADSRSPGVVRDCHGLVCLPSSEGARVLWPALRLR